jgi:hypothetical protein
MTIKRNHYHEGPETWTRFQEGMKKLFRVPKSKVAEDNPKPATNRKPKKASKG